MLGPFGQEIEPATLFDDVPAVAAVPTLDASDTAEKRTYPSEFIDGYWFQTSSDFTTMRSFSVRMWATVAFIESGRNCDRQLDEAFENYDGHAMSAALTKLAESRPALSANLRKYVRDPAASGWPWIIELAKRPMKEIRDAALLQRDALAEFNARQRLGDAAVDQMTGPRDEAYFAALRKWVASRA